ncbi:site-specific integrase [uncultured Intestinimonas sp.]|uniref:site-specific integrase n=1 Tax=uncultured Intestinimonas sp. TaxID=1689265 RepID=UPI0025D1F3B6|nr:site-specific integrase [uncultured Intestinimonas sp.]
MAERRKDSKNRVLRNGESQRKDGAYMYRYTDVRGKRVCVYARTLEDLRVKEQTIQKELNDGIDYAAGEIIVLDLLKRYIATKTGVRYNTKVGYQFVLNLVSKENFGFLKIRDIKPSDAKQWFIKLYQDGRRYSTITSVRGVLRPAFEMAVEDDIIRRNPFSFQITDVVPNDSKTRQAISGEVKERFLTFIRESRHYSQYYDEIIILLGTGMRVSELYGLTWADLDFEARRIKVERQLTRTRHCEYYVEKPKTASGERYIPMTDEVYRAFQNAVQRRKQPKVELLIDGHTGFLFLDKDGKPKVAMHLEHVMKRIVDRYNDAHEDKLPSITPHVLRHTFCTEMANSGIDLKSLQYLMGHSDAGVTLNVYTHASYEAAENAMRKAVGSG